MIYKRGLWRSHDLLPLNERKPTLRILITGSRTWPHPGEVLDALGFYWELGGYLTVVHGDCPQGPDRVARNWVASMNAEAHKISETGRVVDEERFPARWSDGKHAGFDRNAVMVETEPDYVLAFSDVCKNQRCKQLSLHGSHGTDHCAGLAKAAGIETVVVQTWHR